MVKQVRHSSPGALVCASAYTKLVAKQFPQQPITSASFLIALTGNGGTVRSGDDSKGVLVLGAIGNMYLPNESL